MDGLLAPPDHIIHPSIMNPSSFLLRPLFFLLLLSSLTGISQAQSPDTEAFEARYFVNANEDSLRYRLYLPEEMDPEARYPVVVFLHGAGERGHDNQAQLKHVVRYFTQPFLQTDYPCIVLAPQAPKAAMWSHGEWDRQDNDLPEYTQLPGPSLHGQLVMNLLETLQEELPINQNRIYLVGLSMGAFGIYDLLSRFPGTFAAAVPICGGGDATQAPEYAHVPLWIFHGEKDPTVPVSMSRAMVNALRLANGRPIYTELPGVGHNAWDYAFTEDPFLYDWLFSQYQE
jgi:predicted peptidase